VGGDAAIAFVVKQCPGALTRDRVGGLLLPDWRVFPSRCGLFACASGAMKTTAPVPVPVASGPEGRQAVVVGGGEAGSAVLASRGQPPIRASSIETTKNQVIDDR
jgi:hypothetical protein